MALNPFRGQGQGVAGGLVARLLGLGSQSPLVRGITATAAVVALVLFGIREYYDIITAKAQSQRAQAEAAAATDSLSKYVDLPTKCRPEDSKAQGGTGYPYGLDPKSWPDEKRPKPAPGQDYPCP